MNNSRRRIGPETLVPPSSKSYESPKVAPLILHRTRYRDAISVPKRVPPVIHPSFDSKKKKEKNQTQQAAAKIEPTIVLFLYIERLQRWSMWRPTSKTQTSSWNVPRFGHHQLGPGTPLVPVGQKHKNNCSFLISNRFAQPYEFCAYFWVRPRGIRFCLLRLF